MTDSAHDEFEEERPTRYTRVEDAMVMQMQMRDFVSSSMGKEYLDAFQFGMNLQHPPGARMPPGLFHALQYRVLTDADPVYVSGTAMDVVDYSINDATPAFEPEALLPGDPFAPQGFALLPRDYWITGENGGVFLLHDEDGNAGEYELPVRALSWQAVHTEDLGEGCYWMSFYSDTDRLPIWMLYQAFRIEDHDELRAYARRYAPLLISHMFQWTWGQTPWQEPQKLPTVEGEDAEATAKRAYAHSRFVQAFWRIASQLVPVKERAPRALWRENQRKKSNVRDVTVIKLRRQHREGEHDETGRTITVSFPVRGHWRNQPYPSLGIDPTTGKNYTRQIWIAPYIKGDDSLPFQQKGRAWSFER